MLGWKGLSMNLEISMSHDEIKATRRKPTFCEARTVMTSFEPKPGRMSCSAAAATTTFLATRARTSSPAGTAPTRSTSSSDRDRLRHRPAREVAGRQRRALRRRGAGRYRHGDLHRLRPNTTILTIDRPGRSAAPSPSLGESESDVLSADHRSSRRTTSSSRKACNTRHTNGGDSRRCTRLPPSYADLAKSQHC